VAASLAAALVLAGAGCSGDDAGSTTPVDAAVDAPGIDAFACAPLTCAGEMFDGCLDEVHCGDCNTTCEAGNACQSGACECPPSFVPAAPAFLQDQVDSTMIQGVTIGIGGMIDSTIDAMIVGYPTGNVQVDHAYDLSQGTPGVPPFVGVGYDIDLDTFTPSAAFYATRGTLTFTEVCGVGFKGTVSGAHFVAVMGLMNPTLVDNECAFDVPAIAFEYGDPCPTPE
jgi:hypothetical protein